MQRLNEDYNKLLTDNTLLSQSAELAFQKAVEAFKKSANGYQAQIDYNDAYITYINTTSKLRLENSQKARELEQKQNEFDSTPENTLEWTLLGEEIYKLKNEIDANNTAIENAELAWGDVQAKYSLININLMLNASRYALQRYINSLSFLRIRTCKAQA